MSDTSIGLRDLPRKALEEHAQAGWDRAERVELELAKANASIGALKRALAAHHNYSNCLCRSLGTLPEDA